MINVIRKRMFGVLRIESQTSRRLLSFIGVGVGSSACYLATLSILTDMLSYSVFVSAFFAFCVGTLVSYLGNTFLTFRAAASGSSFMKFLAVVLLGLGFNQVIAYGLGKMGVHYVFIALAVFIVVPAVNFIGHSVFTYREKGS